MINENAEWMDEEYVEGGENAVQPIDNFVSFYCGGYIYVRKSIGLAENGRKKLKHSDAPRPSSSQSDGNGQPRMSQSPMPTGQGGSYPGKQPMAPPPHHIYPTSGGKMSHPGQLGPGQHYQQQQQWQQQGYPPGRPQQHPHGAMISPYPPAYVLANNGYDVWLHNTRGTKYSQTHTELNTTQSKFWSYSFEEMGKYDIPAAIDGIIETTGCKKIFYVGHSLGTTQFFASMSLQPEQNKKIIAMFALAPVSYLSNIKSVIGLAAKLSTLLRIETELFGHFEVGSDSKTVNKLMSYICTSSEIRKEMCQNLMFLISGNGKEQLYEPWYSTFVGHVPAPTSSKTLIHLAQGIQSKRFALYDYGWKNYAKYKKCKSPDINLKLVTAPVHLFNGENDLLSVVADVQKLREELPNVQLYTVPYEKWNHLDFILGKEINKYINTPLLRRMKDYEKQLPVQN